MPLSSLSFYLAPSPEEAKSVHRVIIRSVGTGFSGLLAVVPDFDPSSAGVVSVDMPGVPGVGGNTCAAQVNLAGIPEAAEATMIILQPNAWDPALQRLKLDVFIWDV